MPNEQLNDILFEIEQAMKAKGLPEMNDEQLREAYRALSHPEFQQAWTTGQWTPQRVAEEIMSAQEAMHGGGQPAAQGMLARPPQAMPGMMTPQLQRPVGGRP